MKLCLIGLLALTPLATPASPASPAAPAVQDWPVQAAPFDALRWPEESPERPQVRVAGRWYAWERIDEVKVAELIEFCQERWPRRWKKRVGEDLVEALVFMGQAPGKEVELELVDPESGVRVVKEKVAMTRAKRNAVRDYNFDPYGPPRPGPTRQDDDEDDEFETLSPFTAVRARGEDYEVELDGSWYRLVALDGIEAARLRMFCAERYGRRAEKRFAEDLVQVLAELGHEHDGRVDLELVSLENGERVSREDVAMTAENRSRVWRYRNEGGAAAAPVRRVEREHAASVPPALASLARPLAAEGWDAGAKLGRSQAEEDLDQLEWSIEHEHSYRDLRGGDYRAAFDAVRAGLGDEVSRGAFAVKVMQLVARFGDGHAGVRGGEAFLPAGCLPFLLADAQGGVVAFRPDRGGFLDPERPYVLALDGRTVDEWVAEVAAIVPAGSPAWLRYRGLRTLRFPNFARLMGGRPLSAEIEVTLADAGGERPHTLRLPLADKKPIYGPWPRSESRLFEGGIGYLRIASMSGSPDAAHELETRLAEFAGARGLIVDVRGNGGGTRDLLRALLPRLVPADAAPRVVNVAAYRLRPGDERGRSEGYLDNRYLYPRSSARWSPAAGTAIDTVAAEFRPDWTPPAEDFSTWHYFVLEPDASERARFDRCPVVVLLDTGCFSATDVFLGALADLPQVTLMGTPSGGGSGRSQGLTLAHSGLALRLSSMASFRAGGTRYDGRGVQPDVLLAPIPTDFLAGGTDALLEAALTRLR